jgi:hypothetical protein
MKMKNLKMNEEEIREAMAQLRERHNQEQANLNFKQDVEILGVQDRCHHKFTEPVMFKHEYIQKVCTICELMRIIT